MTNPKVERHRLDVEEVTALREAKYTLDQIARELGYSRNSVSKFCTKHKIPHSTISLIKPDVEQVRLLSKEGRTAKQIAKKLGFTPGAINRMRQKFGIKAVNNRRIVLNLEKVKARLGQKLTYRAIAEEFSCSVPHISNFCIANGLRKRVRPKLVACVELAKFSHLSRKDLAAKYDVDVGTIKNWFDRCDLEITKREPLDVLCRPPSFTCSPRAIERALAEVSR